MKDLKYFKDITYPDDVYIACGINENEHTYGWKIFMFLHTIEEISFPNIKLFKEYTEHPQWYVEISKEEWNEQVKNVCNFLTF